VRRIPRAPRLTLAIAGALVCVCAFAQTLADPFDPRRDGARDVAAAVAQAQAAGKRVIVDVGGEWCAWCHVMDRFIARHPGVRSRIDDRYVWVKVNWSKENRNEALLARWPKVAGYPHLFVLDGDGTLLHSQDTSRLEAGDDYDEAKFLAFLERWSRTDPRAPGSART
jgi:thiol:disulfide interchange protein